MEAPIFERETWMQKHLDSGLVLDLERRDNLDYWVQIAFRYKNLQLRPTDLARIPAAEAARLAFFLQIVAESHPSFSRAWAPDLWRASVLKGWEWRTTSALRLGSPTMVSYKLFAALFREPSDLYEGFQILLEARRPANALFVATRPPYMARDDPMHEGLNSSLLFPIFEAMFERNGGENPITMMEGPEVEAFLKRFAGIWAVAHVAASLQNRWAWERRRVWERRRAAFHRCGLSHEIVAEAMHPRRLEPRIDLYGLDAVTDVFAA